MLELRATGQKLALVKDEVWASGFINTKYVEFTFDEEWNGMGRSAQFTQKNDDGEKITYTCVIDDTGLSIVPNELHTGDVKISVFGVNPDTGDRLTTVEFIKSVLPSGYVEDGATPIPPTPDLYAQLLEKIYDPVKPEIGDNGNWYVGGVDTGVNAEGTDGSTPEIGENGNWFINGVDTGVAAGGSGSASKYTQPEWGSETGIVEILPENTYTANADTEDMAIIMDEFSLVEGNEYTVNFNGVEYVCTCVVVDGNFALGNLAVAGLEGAAETNEPFILQRFSAEVATEMGFVGLVVPLDGTETFTLSIKGEAEVIHAIPAEYMENAGVLCVECSSDFTSADKTYDEIMEAIEGGKFVFAHSRYTNNDGKYIDYYLTLCSVDLQRKITFMLIQGSIQYVKCASDNTWSAGS